MRDPGHPDLAKATSTLGMLLYERGEYDEAVPVLEAAVQLHATRSPLSAELGAAVSELANAHFYAGNYDVADSLNQRALAIHTQVFGDRHPRVADDLINIGAVRFQRAEYTEAERYYREGLSIVEPWFGPDHFRTGMALTMLGRALVFQDRYPDATESLT
ncbi:MAG TPA: tetratricopeptide repeat protein, partial [Pleomorphomonadaceae bacterium]|nr:tetratricopeptide repeat protein [Pleomorphomonadaceae bacterium]